MLMEDRNMEHLYFEQAWYIHHMRTPSMGSLSCGARHVEVFKIEPFKP